MRKILIPLSAAAVLAACTPIDNTAEPPGATPTVPASSGLEPRTEGGVRAAAVEFFDASAAGDYAEAWDLFSAAAKKAINRVDYTRLFELCPEVAQGVKVQIEKVTMDSDHEAHVRASRLISISIFRFVYESGHWRIVPPPDAMHDYRTKTVAQMAKARRARGGCGKR